MCAASDAILRGITLAHKPGAFAVKLSILTLIILRDDNQDEDANDEKHISDEDFEA